MATAHGTDMEKEVFDLVHQLEDTVLDAGRKWAKAVGDAMPVEMPFVRELVKSAFDFGEEVMVAQRKFVHSMMELTRTAARSVPKATRTAPAHRATPRATTKAA
ncbi:MAG: hypothetical protein KGJ77_10935 [Acidobacteriota bacterium]|nr:hypothetical protein [Acidobacteriota bacterium]